MKTRLIPAISSLLVIIGLFTTAGIVHAQSTGPTFMITWKATGSYIPSFYIGKAIPTYGSNITASVELLSVQGKSIPLGAQTLYWYLDGTLIGGGAGVTSVTFAPLYEPPSAMNLQVKIPNYNGVFLTQSIIVPTTLPQAVIYAPFPNNTFSSNPLSLTAIPYFFNIANPAQLSYSWSVNGQSGTSSENPEEANVQLPAGTPSGTEVDASLTISNSTDSTSGSAFKALTYGSQL